MTVIRLTRMGRNKKPFYRNSGWIESIGYFNPVVEPQVLKIDEERYNYWLSVGAKPSTISVNSVDIGKLIGKNGNMINALKTIANGCKAKDGISYKIQVVTK